MTQKDGPPAVERPRLTLLEISNAIITKLTQGELLHAICEALKRAVALEGPLQTTHFSVGVEVNKGILGWWVFEHQRAILRRNLEIERQTPLEHLAFSEGVRLLCCLTAGTASRGVLQRTSPPP